MYPDKCLKCGHPWVDSETIYDYFFREYDGNKERAAETASHYGCTKENPKSFGTGVIGIETPEYDGVSYWECKECGTRFNRWTMLPVEEKDE